MNSRPIRIRCLLRDQFAHVQPLETLFGSEAIVTRDGDWEPDAIRSDDTDVVLCVNDYPFGVAQCLDAARCQSIPSIVLQDGILEWRCQYENPLFGAGGGGPQHQPVIADKIACIGPASARQIAAWGNADRVEVTGSPRLDYLADRKFRPISKPGATILVLTAKNPGFTPEQSERTITSLRDLRDGLRKLPHIRPLWRIRPDIAAELGVDHEIKECASAELVATVERADAVIATASTAMLESMFLDRPVALLDYHNCPRFVQTAWCISAPDHILPVVEEILNPPAAKLAFQRDCLMDNLEIDGRACERVRALIQKTTAIAEQCRVEKRPLQFPANLLAWENRKTLWRKPPLAALYPGQSVFEDDDVLSLQVRLARAHRENRSLSEENLSLKRRLRIATLVRDAFRTVAGGMRLHRAADARS